MTPDDVAAYFDDPDNAAAMCKAIMDARPGWTVWRENRTWKAHHDSWPNREQPWESWNAGLLNERLAAYNEQAAT